MRSGLLGSLLVVALLTSVLGCQRVTYNKSFNLSPGEVLQGPSFSPPTYAQRVSITITPSGAPVSAYVCKTSDDEAVRKALDAVNKEPDAALLIASRVSNQSAETYTLEASIPAKTGYTLWLRNGTKSNEVKVNLVGK